MENHTGKCVLIYEDNQEILLLCSLILTKYGYRAVTMPRCEDVLSDMERIQPDIVLMDLWIPEIGGERAITLIKQNPATRHIPVLVFSANTDIKAICKKINADGYLEKPFEIQTFTETIAMYILQTDHKNT